MLLNLAESCHMRWQARCQAGAFIKLGLAAGCNRRCCATSRRSFVWRLSGWRKMRQRMVEATMSQPDTTGTERLVFRYMTALAVFAFCCGVIFGFSLGRAKAQTPLLDAIGSTPGRWTTTFSVPRTILFQCSDNRTVSVWGDWPRSDPCVFSGWTTTVITQGTAP